MAPKLKLNSFSKIVGFTGFLYISGIKSVQYISEKYPDKTHELLWSKLNNRYFENKSNHEWILNNIDIFHSLAYKLLKYRLFPAVTINTPDLSVKFGEYTFPNPLGNSSGIDRLGDGIDGLSRLGFGFVEVGDVGPEQEYWQDRPKYIDCYQKVMNGSKSVMWKYVYMHNGVQNLLETLCQRQLRILNNKYTANMNTLLGISLIPAKSTIDSVPYLMKMDYENSAEIILEFSDYILINICEKDKSRRNSMAQLREKQELQKLIKMIKNKITMTLGKIAAYEYSKIEPSQGGDIINVHNEIRKIYYRNSLMCKNNVPLLLLKIDSYLTEEEYKIIAEVMEEEHVDGVVVGSTIPVNVGLQDRSQRVQVEDVAIGGAGGEVAKDYANNAVKIMYRFTKGKKLLVSSGGIFTGQDMYERMANGASLVQVYSALAFRGPYVAKYILEEFSEILKKNNENVKDVVGKNIQL